jgi:hypothetical protein
MKTADQQLKTYLLSPGKTLRSKSPDIVSQELDGYLLSHYAISALICRAGQAAQGPVRTVSKDTAPRSRNYRQQKKQSSRWLKIQAHTGRGP